MMVNFLYFDITVEYFILFWVFQSQAADAALLFFTPDLKDRIRQSVCPSDLMVFTPPL